MIKIRTLNEDGKSIFENYIESLKAGQKQEFPLYLLESSIYTDRFEIDIELDPEKKFGNRYEMMTYLSKQMEQVDVERHKSNVGLWNWLALFWFDQICPSKNESFVPREISLYLYSTRWNRRTRHLIYSSWLLVSRHKGFAKIFLDTLDQRGDVVEQIMGRQELWSSETVIRLVNTLYHDGSSFKRGAAGQGAGSIRRLADVLQQFACTYDLSSMTQNELLDLLPKEFDQFIN